MRAGAVALLALVLGGCGGGDADAPFEDRGPTRLTVQETAGVPAAFVAFGVEKGFFARQKLRLDLQQTQGGAATIPALVSGEVDVGGSNVVSLLLAGAKDLPIRVIAGGTTAGPKDFGALLVAKGSDIRSPRDLWGRTIGVNTLNNVAEVAVKAALEKRGVDPGSVKLSEVPFPDMQRALAEGTVDATFSIEPFVTRSVRAGDAVLAHPYVETERAMQIGAYAVTDEFAQTEPEAVQGFRAAIAETAGYVAAHEDEFRSFLSKDAGVAPDLARSIALPRWTGRVDADSLANTARLMRRYGLVDAPVDAGALLEGGGA